MTRKFLFTVPLSLCFLCALAQDSTKQIDKSKSPFAFSGFVDAYYSYDFNRPVTNVRPAFLYNYNRHNEFNINLAYGKASYTSDRVRANLALAAGTYMNANYAAEPGTLKNIFEANAGYKVSAKKELWLDAGILPSHIGFESAVSKDQWALTRSLVAENSPYYEAGARLSYASQNGKWQLAALALNGWQRISRVPGNSVLSWGTQLAYKPSDKALLNWSTFVGSDRPDSARLWRYYHNLYGIFQLTKLVGLTLGFDVGMEDQLANSTRKSTWYAPLGILRIAPNAKWAMALRGEYFGDAHSVIVSTGTPHGFKTVGGSLNLDYLPQPNVALRVEGRFLKSKDAVFSKGLTVVDHNTALTFSMAVSF